MKIKSINQNQTAVYISFTTEDNIKRSSLYPCYFRIEFEHSKFYFELYDIYVSGSSMVVTAKETGSSKKTIAYSNIDLRSFIDLDVHLVSDEEEISHIEKISKW